MKAKAFDRKFETGQDVTEYLDLKGARRPGHEHKRVNVDFPIWMIQSLDREAGPIGSAAAVTHQSASGGAPRETGPISPLRVKGDARWLGAITPIGGIAFLTGWMCLAWHVWRGVSYRLMAFRSTGVRNAPLARL